MSDVVTTYQNLSAGLLRCLTAAVRTAVFYLAGRGNMTEDQLMEVVKALRQDVGVTAERLDNQGQRLIETLRATDAAAALQDLSRHVQSFNGADREILTVSLGLDNKARLTLGERRNRFLATSGRSLSDFVRKERSATLRLIARILKEADAAPAPIEDPVAAGASRVVTLGKDGAYYLPGARHIRMTLRANSVMVGKFVLPDICDVRVKDGWFTVFGENGGISLLLSTESFFPVPPHRLPPGLTFETPEVGCIIISWYEHWTKTRQEMGDYEPFTLDENAWLRISWFAGDKRQVTEVIDGLDARHSFRIINRATR